MSRVVSVSAEKVFTLARSIVEDGRSVRITVNGNSMYPFLRSGLDSVELASADFESLKIGDIVLIRRISGEFILHRIYRKNDDSFCLVGDAQGLGEGPVYNDQLQAKAIAVWRGNVCIDSTSCIWRLCAVFFVNTFFFRKLILKMMRIIKCGYDVIRGVR